MYRKMRESGLTEIIPFKCLSAIWGQRPVFFSHLSGPQCSVRRGCSSIAVRQQTFFFLGTLHTQKFTFGGPESLMVVTSLFIDTAGNTPFDVIAKYYLCSPRCTLYPCSLFILHIVVCISESCQVKN